ncbi:MAG: DUF4037 domain-containing protein [Christensenellales bacterium]
MNGLQISREFFFQRGLPMLQSRFPAYIDRIAAGLVGEGSECFGFDDELSKDHDWGPSFCIWLTENDYETAGKQMQEEYAKLDGAFLGCKPRNISPHGEGRTGVFSIGSFYKRFLGVPGVPVSLEQWRRIPESNLAAATNGQVFADPLGEFSCIRDRLAVFYPEDIRIKKIVARAASMAQSGQYNYGRSLRRREYVAAHLALGEFIRSAISMVFLLNKKYCPFYKWMHRALGQLPVMGDSQPLFAALCTPAFIPPEQYSAQCEVIIEEICQKVIRELHRQHLSDTDDSFLLNHCPDITEKIHDAAIRSLFFASE